MNRPEFDFGMPPLLDGSALQAGDSEPDLSIVRNDAAETTLPNDAIIPIIASDTRRAVTPAPEMTAGVLVARMTLAGGGTAGHEPEHAKDAFEEHEDGPGVGAAGGSDEPPKGPPEIPSPAPDNVPDPVVVAERIAEVTNWHPGDSVISLDGMRRSTFFDVMEDGSSGIATVAVQHVAEERSGLTGPRSIKASKPIGHYDPATESWKLYPEFVHPAEQVPLAAELEARASMMADQLRREADESHRPLIDLRHDLTIAARQHMTEYLQHSGLTRHVLDRAVAVTGEILSSDDNTTATFVLSSRYDGPGIGLQRSMSSDAEIDNPSLYQVSPDQVLNIEYRGAIIHQDGHTDRVNRIVPIAACSQDDVDEIWIPDPDLVTFDEWAQIVDVPATLVGYRGLNADFSTEHCAIVRNLQPGF